MFSRMQSRIVFLFCCFFLTILLLLGKVAYLQIYRGEELANQAVENRTVSLDLGNFYRGDILDCQGRSLLDSQLVYYLAVFPSLLPVEQLSTLLPEHFKQLEMLLNDRTDHREPFLLDNVTLTEEEAAKLSQLRIPGLYAIPLIHRFGYQALARHIVGSTKGSVVQGDLEEGIKGIELLYNKELTPSEPVVNFSVVVDGRGELLKGGSLYLRGKKGVPVRGKDVVLTLDRGIQQTVEKVMDRYAEKGAAVVIDIPSGEIRALVSCPSFSYAEGFIQGEEFDRSLNLYHPGSVFKIVVAAAALSEGVVHADEKFDCDGHYVFQSGEEIACWKEEGHGELTLKDAFAHSCNEVFVEVAQRLGSQKLEEYAGLLGLEEGITGYTLQDFQGGVVRIGNLPGQVGNAALGQDGVTICPVNLAALAAVSAQEGIYQKPSLIKEVRRHNGDVVKEIKAAVPKRVLSPHVAEELQEMLELAVDQGTGKRAQIPGLGSAGKTGSAESGRVDDEGESVIDSLFVGYAPLEKPQMAIAVIVEGGGAGGDCAAVIFKEIIELLQMGY
jgi:penicillin-binding protein 2